MNDAHAHGDCRELAERLSEFVDGELPDDLRREVEAHIDDCSTCERFVASLSRVRDLGRLLKPPVPDPERLRAMRQRVRSRLASDTP